MLYCSEFAAGICKLFIVCSENFIEEIDIEQKDLQFSKYISEKLKNSNLKLSPQDKERPAFSYLNDLLDLLDNYFSGKQTSFDLIPVNFRYYSDFAKTVLIKTRLIPCGTTMSYMDLTSCAGFDKKYSRAVASVLASNKTPIVIPCHRVIMSNGATGGYSGGEGNTLKIKLLSLESAFAFKSN